MDNTITPQKPKTRWGLYFITGIIVAAVCVAVLLYIGWIDNNTHVDSRDGDNVLNNYETVTAQPEAPAINDWNNPDGNTIQEIIVDHASGTDVTPMPE